MVVGKVIEKRREEKEIENEERSERWKLNIL
jgi:hypothetical protein